VLALAGIADEADNTVVSPPLAVRFDGADRAQPEVPGAPRAQDLPRGVHCDERRRQEEHATEAQAATLGDLE